MALACVRQRRGRSLANLGFCLIFNGFSLYFGRLIKTTADGESWFTVHGYLISVKITVDG